MIRLALAAALCLSTFAAAAQAADAPAIDQVDVFVSVRDGYKVFRIPALIVSAKGTLLAFCEGRASGSDTGDIDTVLKRSLDGGATWQPLQVVGDDGPNTFGNPCPVVDRDTGTIWLPLTHNPGDATEGQIKRAAGTGSRTVWITKSTDDGVTWAKPVEITATTKDPAWGWYATGPGNGIQMKSGRLVIPCDHSVIQGGAYRSHVIYSDDHGATWKLGGAIDTKVNECAVVERSDGTLLMNMRHYAGTHRRAIATSADGGLTWTKAESDPALVEPICQASLIRFADPRDPARVLFAFSNPANTARRRDHLTVRLSLDEGRTWPLARLICEESSCGYSSLALLPDGRLGCLYEAPRGKIVLARLSVASIDQPPPPIPEPPAADAKKADAKK